jgi:hypothetical protein
MPFPYSESLLYWLGIAVLFGFAIAGLVNMWQKRAASKHEDHTWFGHYFLVMLLTAVVLGALSLVLFEQARPARMENSQFIEQMQPQEQFQQVHEADQAALNEQAPTSEQIIEQREREQQAQQARDEQWFKQIQQDTAKTVTDGNFRQSIMERTVPENTNEVMGDHNDGNNQ